MIYLSVIIGLFLDLFIAYMQVMLCTYLELFFNPAYWNLTLFEVLCNYSNVIAKNFELPVTYTRNYTITYIVHMIDEL